MNINLYQIHAKPYRLSRLEKELQKIEDETYETICKIAEREFTNNILPYLKEKKLTFIAGNGAWWIGNDNGYLDEEKIPKRILNILTTYPNISRANDLGSLMPDYKPEEEK